MRLKQNLSFLTEQSLEQWFSMYLASQSVMLHTFNPILYFSKGMSNASLYFHFLGGKGEKILRTIFEKCKHKYSRGGPWQENVF